MTLLGIDCANVARLIRAAEISQRRLRFGTVKLLSSIDSDHPNIVRIHPIRSLRDYSRFVIKELNDYVDTPHVLIIQHDGFVLNPRAWSDEFLDWDYIGAPWSHVEQHRVGNGGFSLRSKRLLDILQTDAAIVDVHPEDRHICHTYRGRLEECGIRFAPEEVAIRFSIEGGSRYGAKWNGQFGFHNPRRTDLRDWVRANPNVKLPFARPINRNRR